VAEPDPTGDGPVTGDQCIEDAGRDEATMAQLAGDLATAVEAALGPWVRRCVVARYGQPIPAELEAGIEAAAIQVVDDVGPELRQLLALDIDQQWTNPLSIIRRACTYPTSLLSQAGVDPVERDETEARLHPDDVYGLAPASFADLDPAVHEPGLLWGAAKAHLHLKRRKHQEVAG
jgi:hypothetical protein